MTRPLTSAAPTHRRYWQAGHSVRRAAAIACSGFSSLSLSQLAWRGIVFMMVAITGCRPDDGSGGLDPVVPGSLAVTFSGLPEGAPSAATLTGPGGFARSIAGPETIGNLTPGTYQLVVATAAADGDEYQASPSTQSVLVRAGPATTTAVVNYGISTGRLVLGLAGLTDGSATIEITGPGGYSKVATGSETIKKLIPGDYTVRPLPVILDGDRYTGGNSQVLSIAAGTGGTAATATYLLASGRIDLSIAGVPAGATPAVAIAGPNGFAVTKSGSELIKGLEPGVYALSAQPINVDGHLYQPTIAPAAAVVVAANPVAATSSVNFAITTGALTVTISGLPGGAAGAVTVTGPGGFARSLTATTTVTGLVPGGYSVSAANVVVGGVSYVPSQTAQAAPVVASPTPVVRAVQYSIGTGSLSLTLAGLPGSVAGAVTVTGPNGFNQLVGGSQTLSSLAPGGYTIGAASVTSGGLTYQPTPASQAKTVTIGATATATVSYAPTTGGLTISINGLPGAVAAAITVTGPGGFNQTVTATTTLSGLAAGGYTIAAANVSSGGQTYVASPGSQSATVSVGATAAATVNYAGTLGNLALTVSGLPGGTNATITVTGPGGFNQAVIGTQTLVGLASGTYTIAAATVPSGGTTYLPTPTSQTASVTASTTTSKSVTYAGTGSLSLTVAGLPGGASASITVTGPGGYNQVVTASTTLTTLAAGTYTVTAGNVASGGSTYGPTPLVQTASVTVGATAAAAVNYAVLTGVTLNFNIDGMYLTQAAAKYDGTTPVITGRDAYLRVFVLANQANTSTPTVRVRLYSGAALIQTSTITAPSGSVPTAVNQGLLTSSWNLLVPAALVQPNLKILADVDPSNLIAETDDADNTFPTSGSPFSIDVRTVPTWNVRFVPVLQQVNGLQGDVTAGNLAQYLADPLKMLPVAGYSADIRAPYTTTAPALESGNGNGAWGTILSEVWALRSSDASNRYYYGVVKVGYGGGVAGIGYVGSGINVSLGWDKLPSGSGIMAHEVGHNMARPHSPCGGASSPDPSYPYAGGQIGVYGLDLAALTVKAPTTNFDFMGYCGPDWVSDYTWGKLITYRQSNPNYAPPAAPAAGAGLLVWGRMTHQGVILEPAFRVAAPANAPSGPSLVRADGYAADGTLLFSYPVPTAHSMTAGVQTGHDEHFAGVLPLTAAQEQALAKISLVTPRGTVERNSTQALQAAGRQLFLRDPAASVVKPNATQTTLRWDAAWYPMALVRDAATGQILSFARGGDATIWSAGRQVDVTFSDGVRSVVKRAQ